MSLDVVHQAFTSSSTPPRASTTPTGTVPRDLDGADLRALRTTRGAPMPLGPPSRFTAPVSSAADATATERLMNRLGRATR